jgi:exodeoxyribonuclease V beta subunit
MQPFDPLTVPLAGRQLIEASAGTGKTYSIALLYARLILERQLEVDEILVVTFTTSATEELRGRIRDRLRHMLDVVGGNSSGEVSAGRPAVPGPASSAQERDEAVRCLRDALQRMDEAAVYTIHGFCQRMLQDHAFESGVPFAMDFIESEQLLRSRIMEDFWRKRFYSASPEEAAWVLTNWQGPEQLAAAVEGFLARSGPVCVPEVSPDQVRAARERAEEAFGRVRESWRDQMESVTAILRHDPCLSRARDGYGPEPLAEMLDGMNRLAAADRMPRILPPGIERFAACVMAGKLKGRKIFPSHPFFTLFDELYLGLEKLNRWERVSTIASADRYLRTELERRKQALGLMYFDDLLTRFAGALDGKSGSALIRRVRSRFKIAMVDEFQDTDPLQYHIFHTLFGRMPDPALVLIGDPKQSIYSFRGADVFAYLRARNDTPAASRFTMDTNYRSTSAMVHAVNRLFDRERSFIFHGLDFYRVHPRDGADEYPLLVDGSVPRPLQVRLLPAENHCAPGKKTIAKERAAAAAARWAALEIARLLDQGRRGSARIGPDRLGGGDIAVLVRTHQEAFLVQDELRRLNIACVYYSQESVYSSDEAVQLHRVLVALTDLTDESMICDALVTDLFGLSGDALHGLRGDRKTWAAVMDELEEYHAAWVGSGLTVMFHALLIRRGVVGRLLAMGGGERKLTNYLHLLELLQDTAARSGADDLVRWFSQQIHHPAPETSSQQLRLESDENLVKIVTIHRAKGMEYPIVFLPFLWSARPIRNKEIFTFHDRESFRLFVDIGSGEEEHYRQAEEERLAEDLRLLYVALTRARHCCYLAWGRISSMDRSALAWLLHRNDRDALPTADELTEESIAYDINSLNDEGALVRLVSMPAAGEAWSAGKARPLPPLAARTFSGRIDGSWSISSYSRLAASAAPALALPAMPERAAEDEMSVFTFPRGPGAGNFLHGLLETLDFASIRSEEAAALLADRLRNAGINDRWAPVVEAWMEHIVETPLMQGSGLCLKQLSRRDRLTEMGFYFSIDNLEMAAFNAILAEYGFEPVDASSGLLNGLMTGYIDLVFRADGRFYIADYKSNHLGPDYPSYRSQFLREAMLAHRYDLQYLIYTVALHRYLGSRMAGYDYGEHFGGVLYLFLRGMRPDLGSGCGIWHVRPDPGLVEQLDNCFGREVRD